MPSSPFDDIEFVSHPLLGGFVVARPADPHRPAAPEPNHPRMPNAPPGEVIEATFTLVGEETAPRLVDRPRAAFDPAPVRGLTLGERLRRTVPIIGRNPPAGARLRSDLRALLEESRAQMRAELAAWKAAHPQRPDPVPSPATRESSVPDRSSDSSDPSVDPSAPRS